MLPLVSAVPIIGKMLDSAFSVIDKAVEDKDLANEIKARLKTQDYSYLETELQNRANIIVAEVQGKSWLQRNWRPGLMALFGCIIANNYIIYPYLSLFWSSAPTMEVPPDLWALLKLGIGGYIIGRSVEKGVDRWKK